MSWMKHTRWLLPVGAWVLLLLFTGAFYYLIIPCFIGHFEVLGIVIAIAEVLVFFAVVANSLTATFMDPGVIPRASSSEELQHNEHRVPAYILVDVNDITVHLKWCFTCHIYRPPRCSHCSVCDHCVDTLDHHCPWINNCVGRRNYRSFFLFLLVVPAHSVFLFLICFVYTLHTRDDLSTKDNIASILLMVITAAFFMTVIGLTSYHVFLVAFGRTTNEQIHGKYRGGYNPFNKGLLLNVVTVCCAPKFPSFTDYVGRQVMPEEVTAIVA